MQNNNCPWIHAQRGHCVLATNHSGDHEFAPALPPESPRASAALRHAASLVDQAIKAYQNARDVASEEGTPLPDDSDDRIMSALVQADCLVRTQASLRSVRESKRPAPALQDDADRGDGARR